MVSRVCLAVLLLASLALASGQAQKPLFYRPALRKAKVGVASRDAFPWFRLNGTTESGLEVPFRQRLCSAARLNCEVVYLNIPDRVPFLQEKKVDFVVSVFSVTPEREQLIDFVRPLYYSSGVALFAPTDKHSALAAGGWPGLKGKNVCISDGYYATSTLTGTYQVVPVSFNNNLQGLQLVKEGKCEALAFDSATIAFNTDGVSRVAGVEPILNTPYGVGIAKGNLWLYRRLSAALAGMLKAGNNSELLKLEAEYLVPNGVSENTQLKAVVEAVTNFA